MFQSGHWASPVVRMSLLRYILSEVTRSYRLENDQERYTERREKMYTFMRIPRYKDLALRRLS